MKVKESSLLVVVLLALGVTLLLDVAYFFAAPWFIGLIALGLGLIDLCDKQWIPGLIKTLVGLVVVLVVHFAPDIIMYVLAAVLILFGIYQIFLAIKGGKKDVLGWILALVVPVLCIVAGILLLVGTGSAIVTILGIMLVAAAAVILVKDHLLAK